MVYAKLPGSIDFIPISKFPWKTLHFLKLTYISGKPGPPKGISFIFQPLIFSGELAVSFRDFPHSFPSWLEVTPVTAQSSAPLEVSCYNEAQPKSHRGSHGPGHKGRLFRAYMDVGFNIRTPIHPSCWMKRRCLMVGCGPQHDLGYHYITTRNSLNMMFIQVLKCQEFSLVGSVGNGNFIYSRLVCD